MSARLAILTAALAVLPPAPAAAQGQLPPGSYQQSCRILLIDTANKLMKGFCNRIGSGENKTALDYGYCLGDIWNHDGVLGCTLDIARREADAKAAQAKVAAAAQQAQAEAEEAVRIVAARPAFAAAGLLTLGREPTSDEIKGWLPQMASPAFIAGGNPADGVSLVEASRFLRAMLALPAQGELRAEVIDDAYRAAGGIAAPAIEQAAWDAKLRGGDATYASIFSDQRDRISNDPLRRKALLAKAARDAFGRDASEADLAVSGHVAYWQRLEAHRAFLYSPAGAAELAAMADRAWRSTHGGQAPSAAELKSMLASYSASRPVYAEVAGRPRALRIG